MNGERWKAADERRLLALAGTCSMGELGKIFGVTRNVIAGKLLRFRRQGLLEPAPEAEKRRRMAQGGRDHARRKGASKRKPKPAPVRVVAMPPTPTPTPTPKPVPFKLREAPAIDMRRVGLLELGPNDCRFPIGDVGAPGFCFCGNRTPDGRSYCGPHDRHAHGPA